MRIFRAPEQPAQAPAGSDIYSIVRGPCLPHIPPLPHAYKGGAYNSERKIDRIENRLTEVIGVLKTLAAATPHTQQFKSSSSHLDVSTPDSTATRLTLTPGTAHESTALTPATSSGHGCYKKNLPQGQESKFEGETSMAAHTDFANNFLQRAVRSNPLTDFRLEMDDTLSALRTLVETQNRTSSSDEALYPNARPIDRGQVWDRPLPDMYLTMTCLRISKGWYERSLIKKTGIHDHAHDHDKPKPCRPSLPLLREKGSVLANTTHRGPPGS